ncbi:hypothetical protein, partial [Bifidobacterium longum]|uniref:hypothetical protein n=1 Tax=Bifidobacterium longum TaxID=216816 RepID=UPI001F29A7F6
QGDTALSEKFSFRVVHVGLSTQPCIPPSSTATILDLSIIFCRQSRGKDTQQLVLCQASIEIT